MASEREMIQDDLEQFLIDGLLNESYGIFAGLKTLPNGGKIRSITFAKARILDAVINIYSPTNLTVSWRTAIRYLPSQGTQKFTSVGELKEFIKQNFVFEE